YDHAILDPCRNTGGDELALAAGGNAATKRPEERRGLALLVDEPRDDVAARARVPTHADVKLIVPDGAELIADAAGPGGHRVEVRRIPLRPDTDVLGDRAGVVPCEAGERIARHGPSIGLRKGRITGTLRLLEQVRAHVIAQV